MAPRDARYVANATAVVGTEIVSAKNRRAEHLPSLSVRESTRYTPPALPPPLLHHSSACVAQLQPQISLRALQRAELAVIH